MEGQSFDSIIANLKAKKYHPLYFLAGEESYYIDLISDYIQANVLNETEKTFNQTILYGKDTSVAQVMDAAKRFPMMSAYQVVILKEAQEMEKIDDLIHYIEHPQATTILVIAHKHKLPDKRKTVFKTLRKNAVYFESKKLYDNQLPAWIIQQVKSRSYEIDTKGAALLAEFLGSDLSKIAKEIDKLILTLGDGVRKISPAHIERNIGISKDYNNFELQKALGRKDVLKANRIIQYFASNQKDHPVVLTIISMYFFFSKLLIYYWIKDKSKNNLVSVMKVPPFAVRDYQEAAQRYTPNQVISIISMLREYDMKSKGYKGQVIPPGDLLKELTYKILH